MGEKEYHFKNYTKSTSIHHKWNILDKDLQEIKVLCTPSCTFNNHITQEYLFKVEHLENTYMASLPEKTVSVYIKFLKPITFSERISISCKMYMPHLVSEKITSNKPQKFECLNWILIGSFKTHELYKSVMIHCTINHMIVYTNYDIAQSILNTKKKAVTECEEDLDPKIILFTDSEFTDVTFCIGKEKFKAHKAILAAHSPVFKAMFMNNMKERNENVVYIIDISPKAFNNMLQYIYMDTITDMDNSVFDLAIVADKYGLNRLLQYCVVYMTENITSENCTETYITAYVLQNESLKDCTIDFIKIHFNEVKATESFVVARKLHKDIIMDLMYNILSDSNSSTS